MRAILIKTETREIEVIEYDGDWQSIKGLLSFEGRDVDLFDCVQIDEKHTMFVDDEGLLHNPQHFMVWNDYPQPLAGRGLILGMDEETGDSTGCVLDVDWVRATLGFMDLDMVRKVYR